MLSIISAHKYKFNITILKKNNIKIVEAESLCSMLSELTNLKYKEFEI